MQIRASSLETLVTACESLESGSKRVRPLSVRTHYAAAYFAKATLHGRSICSLLGEIKARRYADVAGICALARSLIETHNVFLYLVESGIGADELELRVTLAQLNQAVDLIRISEALEWGSEDTIFWQSAARDHARGVLESNCSFQALGEKERAHLLRGKSPYLKGRFKGTGPVKPEVESAAYNLFSHNVHAYGLSSSYAGSETPAGSANTLFLAVEMSCIYLANLVLRYRAVRPKAVPNLSNEATQQISETLALTYLTHWQDSWRVV